MIQSNKSGNEAKGTEPDIGHHSALETPMEGERDVEGVDEELSPPVVIFIFLWIVQRLLL